MKKFNLKVTIRNAKKNSVLSFAKLFGITLSFAVVLFASAYVYYETSFDKHVPDNDKIFRCVMQGKLDGRDADFAVTSPAMAKAIEEEIPEIEETTRLRHRGNATIRYDNNLFEAKQMLVADPNIFSFFGIPFVTNRKIIFEDPDDIALVKSLADSHFGSAENALNKKVRVRGEDCTITAVFNDLPSNFHLQTQMVKNIKDDKPEEIGWGSQNYYTYLKTKTSNINVDELSLKLTKSVYTNWDDDIDGAKAKSWDDLKYHPETYIFYIAEPLSKIHFSKHRFDPAVTASKTYVFGAIILSVLVLLISSINYINLTIANFSTRFKEIGIRKTSGARNNQIANQFIGESLIFWVLGFAFAVIIYEFSAAHLSNFLGFKIDISNNEFIRIILLSFLILIAFNIVTILLPILSASGKKVLSLIKAERPVNKKISAKNSFVLLQFVLSAFIILSTITVQKQVYYMMNKDRGYDKENILTFGIWDLSPEQRKAFVDELKTYAPIIGIASNNDNFGDDPGMNSAFFETVAEENYFHTSIFGVDDEFANTFNMEILEGRFFDKERQTDDKTALLNETAAKEYEGDGSLIGKKVHIDGGEYTVIGILKDFNFRSLYHEIQPLVFLHAENLGNIYVKTRNNQIPEVIDIVEKQWKKFEINSLFEYSFHDQVVAEHYIKDLQAKKLLLFLSIVSILIACVGLYAISMFTIIRKTKEIGVRKVNGARLSEIVTMLNKEFLKWVIAAFLIACPIAYYAMNKWLGNFAYKTEISWWIFALGGLFALTIAILTVSLQSVRAAGKNPVEALRYE